MFSGNVLVCDNCGDTFHCSSTESHIARSMAKSFVGWATGFDTFRNLTLDFCSTKCYLEAVVPPDVPPRRIPRMK